MSPVKLQLEDPGAPDYAGEVIDILNPAIASDKPSSQNEAAAAIDALCRRECSAAGSAGGFLWWFWDLVHDLSRQLPYDSEEQDRLAAVIKSLTDLPHRNVSLGEEWGSGDASTVELWTNLPMFGNTFREKLDDGMRYYSSILSASLLTMANPQTTLQHPQKISRRLDASISMLTQHELQGFAVCPSKSTPSGLWWVRWRMQPPMNYALL